MKFHCLNPECKRTFVYAAKHSTEYEEKDVGKITEERHKCPYCDSLDFEEFKEPVEEKQVESAVQVEWAGVDALLKVGYVIEKSLSGVKNATLFLYSTGKQNLAGEEK